MPGTCKATVLSTGVPCTKKQKKGDYCGIHSRPPRPLPADEDRCTYVIHGNSGINRRCEKKRKNDDETHRECTLHHNARAAKEERQKVRERRVHIYMNYSMHIWMFRREVAMAAGLLAVNNWMLGHRIVQRTLEIAGERLATLEDLWQAMDEYRAEHPAANNNVPREAQIARDEQNVHTREVTEQHNKNMAILLATPVPEGQQTIPTIRAIWTAIYTKTPVDERVYADMQKWYDTETCRTRGDWLYRRTLDHLYARIVKVENATTRRELFKRLQQECAESYRMCCDGHLNRLTNVMVGFDDAFQQAVPKGLILQEKMAKIAQIENPDERMGAAKALMTELEVGAEEAGAWLEAIAE